MISKPPGLTVILLTENQTLENALPPVTQIAPLAIATSIPFLSPSNGILIYLCLLMIAVTRTPTQSCSIFYSLSDISPINIR